MLLKYYSKVKLVLLNVFAILASLSDLVAAYVLSNLINMAVSKSLSHMVQFLLFGIVLLLVTFGSQYIFNYFKTDVVRSINTQVRSKVLQGMLNKRDDDSTELGFLVNDVKLLETNRFKAQITIISSAYTFVFALSYALYLNWLLTIIFLLGSAFPMVLSGMVQKPIQEASKDWSTKNDQYLNHTKSILNGKKDVFLYNRQEEATQSNLSFVNKLEQSLFKMNLFTANVNTFVNMIADTFTLIFPLVLGTYLISIGQTTVGTLIAIVQLANSFINPIINMLQQRSNLSTTKNIMQKTKEYITEAQQAINDDVKDFNEVKYQGIQLVRDQKTLVDKLDVDINIGNKIAMIGQSGSGKSTLIEYLIYKLNGSSQKILINGKDESNQDVKNLYGYANQKPIIFNDSIRFNLTLGNTEITDEQINEVATVLGIDDVVDEKGLDYVLSDDNGNLSGGQLERINLARTILSSRPILVLDEITASLDKATAQKVHDYLLESKLTLIEIIHHYTDQDLKRYNQVINFDTFN
ncbi:MAG: ABC transporter ATP-binding protein/permease [Apilactobacillus sp.]|uniref:ABC transporter ATP-binding protein n=1 Tax=Apilactobacillus apinorum TaxID=1218495 RepID=UPI0030E760D4|nr:ABC transporter ATP-binding protein/permease [Apilactobacillus sp.]